VENVVAYVCAMFGRFGDDQLWNEKALAYRKRKSDNNNKNNKNNKN